jgi:hypothetical protein
LLPQKRTFLKCRCSVWQETVKPKKYLIKKITTELFCLFRGTAGILTPIRYICTTGEKSARVFLFTFSLESLCKGGGDGERGVESLFGFGFNSCFNFSKTNVVAKLFRNTVDDLANKKTNSIGIDLLICLCMYFFIAQYKDYAKIEKKSQFLEFK